MKKHPQQKRGFLTQFNELEILFCGKILLQMKNITRIYFKPKQGILPMFITDFLDICDPVLTFDKFMEGIDIEKYLKKVPVHGTGRIRYNPVNMLKTVLFGFMT